MRRRRQWPPAGTLAGGGVRTVIRWGVIGPGIIATGFAEAMQWAEGGTITAVASRSAERAEAFGDRFDIPTRYGDYDAARRRSGRRRRLRRHAAFAP